MRPFLPLDTERLLLRPFRSSDAAPFAAYRSDPDVARYQSWTVPYAVEDAARLIAEMDGMDGPVADEWLQIAAEHDGTLAGDVAVHLDGGGRIARVGYTFARAFQGRGLAREAVGTVVARLFGDVGVHRIEASIDDRNDASARLLEELGFEREGTARAAVWADGAWVDETHYGLDERGFAAWAARPRHRPVDVGLVEITPATALAVMELRTHPHQQRFVAPVSVSYADAMFPESVNGAPVVPWMRAVEADGELVGFVMLAERTAQHPEAYLWRLLIDRCHQRRGIGDRVLDLLVARLRAEGHGSMLVSWRPGRGGPEPFYLRRGFVPTGVVDEGEVEARLTL